MRGRCLEVALTHIVRPSPEHLHRCFDGARNFRRFQSVIDREPAPKSSADQGHIHFYFFGRRPEKLCHFFLQGIGRLGRCPDDAAISSHIGDAIHRLDGSMRVERIKVARVDCPCGRASARRRFVFASNKALLLRSFIKPFEMRLGIERILWWIFPFDRKRGAAFQSRPGRLTDDSDPARGRDEAHAANRERFCVLRTLLFRPAPRWSFDRGVEHSRDFRVNAVARRASHDVASIDALNRFSNQAKITRLFQWRIGWDRKLGGIGDQGCVLETASTRRVDNLATCCGTSCAINFPPRRGRRREHLASGGTGLAQSFPTASETKTATSAESFEIRTRRGLHQLDARPISFELVGQNHRERSANALTHLRFSDGQSNGPVGSYADPSIRLELSRCLFSRAQEPPPVEGDDERRAPERGCLKKGAARSDHGLCVRSATAARRIALRMRG